MISVTEWEGEMLDMARISRLDMGVYLCIASNGIPPTVSKQIKVSVDCKYLSMTTINCQINLFSRNDIEINHDLSLLIIIKMRSEI